MAERDVTHLLLQLDDADASSEALDRLVPMLYEELRRLAHAQLRHERSGHTLNTTALVNEAYLRLVRHDRVGAEDRAQFFAVAATTMRRVLVDYARARRRLKRGGGAPHVPLDEDVLFTEQEADEVLALDEALGRFEALDPRGSQVVQYRFFVGLTLEETADVMGLSVPTVHRAWRAARNWLRKEVSQEVTGL
ncbi:MAG: sigma-70 family RNA polymerase sigma factor [Rubricoccaceae bacterium]|nr:sigma-70 family RNA polymerase sigma factor [Rubricoccaceae bacterium]